MQTVQRMPGKKARHALNEGSPVIDVPKASNSDSLIKEFIALNGKAIRKYVEANFDGVDEAGLKAIIREVAECSVLVRSPKKAEPWGDEVSVIETIVNLKELKPMKAVEQEIEEDPGKELDEEPEEKSTIAVSEIKAQSSPKNEKTEQKKETTEKTIAPTKSTKSKETTKTAVATQAKETTKKVTTKETKPAKKSTTKAITKLSVEALKTFKGQDQWFEAAKYLKNRKEIWIQVQDIPTIIGHLYGVHTGKEKIKEDGFKGKGEKSYRKRRLQSISNAITALLDSIS